MCLQISLDKGFRHVVQSCPNLGNFLIFCIMWHRQRFMSFHFLRKWIMKEISQLLRNMSLLSFLRSGGKKCKKEKIHSISDSFAMRYNLLKGSSGCPIITAYLWLRFPWGFPLAWSRRILECSKRLPGIPGKLRPTDSRCCRGMFRRISFLCRVKWRRAEYQNLCTSNKTNLIRRHPHCPRPIRWGSETFY